MGTSGGPNIINDGLVFSIDGSSRRSTLRNTQTSNILPDPGNWSIGSGGQSGYGANGSSSEQNRVSVSDDPWGRNSITWRTTPDSTSGADGGWNSSSYSVDTNYTYRYVIWVRRYTSGTGGTFYMGMNPAPIRNDNGAVQGNPYWHCPAISSLTQGQWYLVVAHCFHKDHKGLRHPESGWYANGEKIPEIGFCNVGSYDVRWNPGTTSALHRVYHYYTTNVNSGIEFAYPRIDKIDGNEPSIGELLNRGESGITNLINKETYNVINGNNYIQDGMKSTYTFDGTDDYINLGTDLSNLNTSTLSFEMVFKSNSSSGDMRPLIGWMENESSHGYICTGNFTGYWSNESISFYNEGPNTTSLSFAYTNGHEFLNDTNYHHVVFILQTGGYKIYLGGKEVTVNPSFRNGNNSTVMPSNLFGYGSTPSVVIGSGSNPATYGNVTIPVLKIYNKVLTPQEVQKNYNAYKNRFDI